MLEAGLLLVMGPRITMKVLDIANPGCCISAAMTAAIMTVTRAIVM